MGQLKAALLSKHPRSLPHRMLRPCLILLTVACCALAQQRQLILPNLQACANRVKHQATFRNGHYYFFSWTHEPTKKHERDWLDARNICRKHCQDLVGLETQDEAQFVYQAIAQNNVNYIWTSGRKCNFEGGNQPHLQPVDVRGWFWSGSNALIPPTNGTLDGSWGGDWSRNGGAGVRQPDNREIEDGNEEACMAVLNYARGKIAQEGRNLVIP